MEKVIDSFKDEYFFLSNFYPCSVSFGHFGVFDSSEAIFQGLKCPSAIDEFKGLSPSEAKKLGRSVALRRDWDNIKDHAMYQIVLAKFMQHPDLAHKLIATGNATLIEGNTWGDKYWGQVNGEGMNMLGQILMKVRTVLKAMDYPRIEGVN